MKQKMTIGCVLLVLSFLPLSGQETSSWSIPANLGPVVNSEFGDLAPSISKNGLSLYFFSNRPGGFGGNDIWVSKRESVTDGWASPMNLGPIINTSGDENAPWLSTDGHALYFTSDRPGGSGALDLYLSRRQDKRNDLSWSEPENLGQGVNTSFNDAAPTVFDADGEATILFFHSNRAGGDDIYTSTAGCDEIFSPAALVEELSSPLADRLPSVSNDGLEIFLTSNRAGTLGAFDLWVATREQLVSPWSQPVNVGPPVNTPAIEGRASVGRPDKALYFHSTRPGGSGDFDLYVSSAEKKTGDD